MPQTTANLDRFNESAFNYFGRRRTVSHCLPNSPICSCGAWASLKIQNEPHCWDCAEEIGVERIND